MGNPSPPGVYAYEIRIEGFLELPGDDPGNGEEALRLLLGQIVPPGDMPLGDDQAMPLGKGIDIQDYQGKLIFINPIGLPLSRHALTGNTIILGRFQNALRQDEKSNRYPDVPF